MTTGMKLVILDRDGTINEDRDDFVKSEAEWVPLPGAPDAIARLNQAGWHVVLATNQDGLGRGLFEMATLNAIHAKMNRVLTAAGGRVDAVFFCPHRPEENCDCRKPLPGLMQLPVLGALFRSQSFDLVLPLIAEVFDLSDEMLDQRARLRMCFRREHGLHFGHRRPGLDHQILVVVDRVGALHRETTSFEQVGQ